MALFDGTENFAPALEGQRIAIGAGQGAGQSISRGMATAQRSKGLQLEGQAQDLSKQKFEFEKLRFNDMVKQNQLHKSWLDGILSGASSNEDSYWTD